jgi:hypothetical protein
VRSAPKVVGHAVIDGDEIRFVFPELKLHSLNKSGFGMSRGAAMAEMARVRLIRETVRQSVAFVVGMPLRPTWARLTRLSSATMHDEDNLAGSGKPAIDGIARALGFNDRLFAVIPPKVAAVSDEAELIARLRAQGNIALFLSQGPSTGRGMFGVRITLNFGKAAP